MTSSPYSPPTDTALVQREILRVYARGLSVLCEKLPESAITVQKSIEALTSRFGELAGSVRHQGDQVRVITELANAIQLEDERITLEEFNRLFMETLNSFVDRILFVSKKAMDMVYQLDEAMASLATIESFLGDVQRINRQANLLALNACIESVRAGEAGTGFAVVADEMKGVSKQIQVLAKEMEQRIRTVGSSVRSGYELLQDVAATDMDEHLLTKDKLDRLMQSFQRQNVEFKSVLDDTVHATRSIADSISGLVVLLQFQDRNSQYVENSVMLLRDCASLLESDICDYALSAHAAELRIAEGFRLSEFRQRFLTVAHPQENSDEESAPSGNVVSFNSGGDAELF